MEIIFHGKHDGSEAKESLLSVIQMLTERYHINGFREMHLSVTLVDDSDIDVELVDSETQEAYRIFEIFRQGKKVPRPKKRPALKLVVNKPE